MAGIQKRKIASYPIATEKQERNTIVSMIVFRNDLYMATRQGVYMMVKVDGKGSFEPLEVNYG